MFTRRLRVIRMKSSIGRSFSGSSFSSSSSILFCAAAFAGAAFAAAGKIYARSPLRLKYSPLKYVISSGAGMDNTLFVYSCVLGISEFHLFSRRTRNPCRNFSGSVAARSAAKAASFRSSFPSRYLAEEKSSRIAVIRAKSSTRGRRITSSLRLFSAFSSFATAASSSGRNNSSNRPLTGHVP